MSKNLEALGPGGVLAMQVGQATKVFGKPLHRMSAVQLAAFENMSGISGEQLTQLKEVTKGMYSSFSELQRLSGLAKKTGDENLYANKSRDEVKALQMDQVKKFGAFIAANGEIKKASIRGNKLIESQTAPLKNQKDYMLSMGDRLKEAVTKGVPEDTKLARATVKQTTEATRILKQGVEYYLNQIYNILQIISSFFGGMKAVYHFQEQVDAIRKQRESLGKKIGELGVKMAGASKEQKEKMKQQLEVMKKQETSLLLQQKIRESELKAAQSITKGKWWGTFTKEQLIKKSRGRATGRAMEAGAGGAKGAVELYGGRASTYLKQAGFGKELAEEQAKVLARLLAQRRKEIVARGGSEALAKATTFNEKFEKKVRLAVAAKMFEKKKKFEKKEAAKSQKKQKDLSDEAKKQRKENIKKQAEANAKALKESERRALGEKLGLSAEEMDEFIRSGKLGKSAKATLAAKAKESPDLYRGMMRTTGVSSSDAAEIISKNLAKGAAKVIKTPPNKDFLLRMTDMGGIQGLTKIDPADKMSVVGAKPGGPLATAVGAAAGGGATTATGGPTQINITINGNEEKAYGVVLQALKTAGVT
jgi:hypothetical protein